MRDINVILCDSVDSEVASHRSESMLGLSLLPILGWIMAIFPQGQKEL